MTKLNIENLFAFRHFAVQSKALTAKVGGGKGTVTKAPSLAAKVGGPKGPGRTPAVLAAKVGFKVDDKVPAILTAKIGVPKNFN